MLVENIFPNTYFPFLFQLFYCKQIALCGLFGPIFFAFLCILLVISLFVGYFKCPQV